MIIQSLDPKDIQLEMVPYIERMATIYYALRSTWHNSHWYKFKDVNDVNRKITDLVRTCASDPTCHMVQGTGITVRLVRHEDVDPTKAFVTVDVTFTIVPS